MNYRVNPEAWKGVFAVPVEVVDKHIKLAGAVQLKVLLWMLRHSEGNYRIEDLAATLGQAVPDVNDALHYWVENGVLIQISESEEKEKPEIETAKATKVSPVKVTDVSEEEGSKQILPPPPAKPTAQDIVRRSEEIPELKFLFAQAQAQFKRMLSTSEQATLLWIFDYCGLPVEIILMILEYESYGKKLTLRNVEKTALRWAELEIDTIEKAEKILIEAKNTDKNWKEVSSLFGLDRRKPTKKEEEYLHLWYDEWGFSRDMIQLAYEENLNQTAKLSLAYINGILKKWQANNIRTPKAVQMSKQAFVGNKKSTPQGTRKNETRTPASYDLETYDRMLKNGKLAEKYAHLMKEEQE